MSNGLMARSMMAAALAFSVASVFLLAAYPLGSYVRFGWPLEKVLGWDAALSLLFFLQHSGMVRRPVRAALHIPEHYQGAVYAIASGVTLAVVALLWQSSDDAVLVLAGPPRVAAHVCSILALLVFVWGIVALRKFDPVGIGAVRAHLRGVPLPPLPFVARGPYRWVRHPLYFAVLVLIWANPDLTVDRLLFNVLWSAWILVGTRLEEADLVKDFGEAYERYQRNVPMLIPWRGPARI